MLPALGANWLLFSTDGFHHGWVGYLWGNVGLFLALFGMSVALTLLFRGEFRRRLASGDLEQARDLLLRLDELGMGKMLEAQLPSELGRTISAGLLDQAAAIWEILEPRLEARTVHLPLALANWTAYLVVMGRYQEALELSAPLMARRALPRAWERACQALLASNRASAHMALGEYEEASQALAQGLSSRPRLALVREALLANEVSLALHMGRIEEASSRVAEFLSRTTAPRVPRLWALLLARLGDKERVTPLLARARPTTSDRERFWEEAARGFLAANLGDRARAREHFEHAGTIVVPVGETLLAAARLLLGWGETAAARQLLDAIRRRDPESLAARNAARDFSSLLAAETPAPPT